jgi:hypothetical protein
VIWCTTPPRAPQAQQRNCAQGYADHDRRAPGRLQRAHRVAERDDSGQRADQRFEVEESPGRFGRDPLLAVGEQGERDQRAEDGQRQRGQDRARRVRYRRQPLRDHGIQQSGQGRPEELHRGDRDRVPVAQYPVLGHGERGRHQDRQQHQAIADRGGTAAMSAGDQADPGQRHPEPEPGHRPGHGPLPDRGDHRDQHRHRADQQRGVGHAGQRDAPVLQDHRAAVSGRAGEQHQRRARTPQPTPGLGPGLGPVSIPPGHHEQDRGGQAEPGHGQPARRQPGQGELGQRNGGAPQRPGSGQGRDGEAAVVVHAYILSVANSKLVD